MTNQIYIPTTGSKDWQWLLASPGLHWKHGASAMALADAWETADPWPPKIASAFETCRGLEHLELLVALPEHGTPLPGGTRASQTDLLVLARKPLGGLVSIAVEGKAEEPFGDKTVAEWRAVGGAGRAERLSYLLNLLKLPDDDSIADLRYQLLHRTAAAVIEAQRFGGSDAVMVVHSFSPNRSWFDDYAHFVGLLGATAESGTVSTARVLDEVTLHLGWVSDEPLPLTDQSALGERIDRAFAFARELHAAQTRKETEIPYIAHLMGVASLVIEDGGSEDEAIAALLHDAVEDQGGKETQRLIDQLFGRRAGAIVAACSDTDVVPKPAWRERKEAYVAHLADPNLPEGAVRVSLADKLHNARSILFDLRAGHDVWSKFNADREQQAWYYGALAEAFAARTDSPMVDELRRVNDQIFVDG